MAIQQVGGSKVYVITGSRKDPSLTSSGQSWANLVTSQKYQLWKEAQAVALQDYKQGLTTYENEKSFYDASRKQLLDEIEQNKKNLTDLQEKKLKADADAQNRAIREENLRGRPTRTSTGGGRSGGKLPYTDPVEDRLSRNLDVERDNLEKKQQRNDKIDKDIAKLKDEYGGAITPLNEQQIKTLESQKQPITQSEKNSIADLETKLSDRRAMSRDEVEADLRKREGRGEVQKSGGGYTITPGQPIAEEKAPEYSSQIAQYQAEQDRLAGELKALRAPTMPEFDYLQSTRDIYTGKFGQGSPGLRQGYTNIPANIQQRQAVNIQPSQTSKTSTIPPEKLAEYKALATTPEQEEKWIQDYISTKPGGEYLPTNEYVHQPDLSPKYDGQKFGEAFPMESRQYPIVDKQGDYIKPAGPETPFDVRGTSPSRDLIEGNTTFEETADKYGYKGVSPYTPNWPKELSYADIAREQGRKAYEADLQRQAQLEARQNRADLEFLGQPLGDLPPAQMPYIPETTYRSNLGEQAGQSLEAMSEELRGYQPPQSLLELKQKREFIQNPPQFGAYPKTTNKISAAPTSPELLISVAAPSPTPGQPQSKPQVDPYVDRSVAIKQYLDTGRSSSLDPITTQAIDMLVRQGKTQITEYDIALVEERIRPAFEADKRITDWFTRTYGFAPSEQQKLMIRDMEQKTGQIVGVSGYESNPHNPYPEYWPMRKYMESYSGPTEYVNFLNESLYQPRGLEPLPVPKRPVDLNIQTRGLETGPGVQALQERKPASSRQGVVSDVNLSQYPPDFINRAYNWWTTTFGEAPTELDYAGMFAQEQTGRPLGQPRPIVPQTQPEPEIDIYEKYGITKPADYVSTEELTRRLIEGGRDRATLDQFNSMRKPMELPRQPSDPYGLRTYDDRTITLNQPAKIEEKIAPVKEQKTPQQNYFEYKSNVILTSTKMTKQQFENEILKDTDYSKLVLQLYPIDAVAKYGDAKADEMLQNAWNQIQKTYANDPKKMKSAHELLIANDNLQRDTKSISNEDMEKLKK